MVTKNTLALLTAAILMLAATAVFAGRGMDMGGCNQKNVDIATFKQFQKETSALRDDMMVKRIEYQREQAKDAPDQGKVTVLKQEMTTLRTQIHEAGKKYGMFAECDQNQECWDKADFGMMAGGCGQGGKAGCGTAGCNKECGKNCGADCSKDCAKGNCGKAGCNKKANKLTKQGCNNCNKNTK
jgi:hypothetical protein